MKTYFKILNWLENGIMVGSLLLMLILVFLNVIVRKFTSFSFAFTEEIVSPLFILVTLIGSAALARKGGHVGLSILTDLLPEKLQRWGRILISLVSLTFCITLLYFGIMMVKGEIASGMRTAALMWPEWVFGSFVPIGAFFLSLEFLNYAILTFFPSIEIEAESVQGE